jgi:FtsP/CotA-like multicopper oxidase with cupredoxin domain
MERFAWSFDGIPFASAEPLRLTYGERMRIVLVNDTMMSTHPPARHVERSGKRRGAFQVRKHTIDMPPGSAAATACAPTPSAVGPGTATCSTTWKRA